MKEIWRTHKHPWFGFGGFPEVSNENISGDCDLVHNLDWKDRCDFVLHNENCLDVDGFINYISVLYCNFGEHLFPLGLVLYLVWMVMLFIALAVSADDFFCPAIQVISKTLRLSQNIAGVTIMALGNGAPDIFSSLAGISAARPELVFGELFGAGVFVTTVVAGSVAITKPFKVMERPFLRDVSFYLMAGFWAFYIFWRQEIRLGDALGFLALYIVYIAVVIIGRYVHSKTRTTEPYYSVQTNEVDEQIVPTHREVRILTHPLTTGNPPEIRLLLENQAGLPAKLQIRRFYKAINPIDRVEWEDNNLFWKTYFVLKSPLDFIFRLTIPRVSPENADESWCQILVLIQCFLTPLFTALATSTALDKVGSTELTVYQLILVFSPLVAIIVAFTSRSSVPPAYNTVFAFLGFIVSVVWIYVIANELVSLLKAIGVIFGLTDAILGLTVLAWGNSIGDLIADTAMARRGQPRTGFSACFGGPLFNLLLGIGLPFTIEILRGGGAPIPLQFNVMTLSLSMGLGSSLLFSFILLPCIKFTANKTYGSILFVM